MAEASEAASTVVLDAGGSYDEDSPEATLEEKVAAGFTWEWECAEKTPGTGYGSYCGGYCGGSDSFGSDSLGSDSFGVGEELKSSSGSRISLAPSDLASLLGGSASSRSFEFLVVISDSGSRTVSSRTILVVSPESLPSISIQPMGRLKINPSKKLRIQGGVVRPGAGQGVVSTWEETTGRMGSLAEVIGSNGGVGVGRTVEGGGEEGELTEEAAAAAAAGEGHGNDGKGGWGRAQSPKPKAQSPKPKAQSPKHKAQSTKHKLIQPHLPPPPSFPPPLLLPSPRNPRPPSHNNPLRDPAGRSQLHVPPLGVLLHLPLLVLPLIKLVLLRRDHRAGEFSSERGGVGRPGG